MSGPVDFYSQTLDTTGIGVTSTPGLDEEDEEDKDKSTEESEGQDDNPPSILETSFGGGLKNLNEVVNFGVNDINFGVNSNNTYSF